MARGAFGTRRAGRGGGVLRKLRYSFRTMRVDDAYRATSPRTARVVALGHACDAYRTFRKSEFCQKYPISMPIREGKPCRNDMVRTGLRTCAQADRGHLAGGRASRRHASPIPPRQDPAPQHPQGVPLLSGTTFVVNTQRLLVLCEVFGDISRISLFSFPRTHILREHGARGDQDRRRPRQARGVEVREGRGPAPRAALGDPSPAPRAACADSRRPSPAQRPEWTPGALCAPSSRPWPSVAPSSWSRAPSSLPWPWAVPASCR